MAERQRLTRDDVVAARHALARVDARIREDGEAAVITEIWDAAVDEVAGLPEVAEAVKQFARAPQGSSGPPSADEREAEAVHQAVVKLVQDAQQMEDDLRASGDRKQPRG